MGESARRARVGALRLTQSSRDMQAGGTFILGGHKKAPLVLCAAEAGSGWFGVTGVLGAT